jgi:hypothetical protein
MKPEFPVNLVEYGKYFLQDGSSDYSILAYTRDARPNLKAYNDYLQLRDNSYFDEALGNTSAALLPIDKEKYLFAQLHRRSEGELNPERSPTNRPFTQIRFTQFSEVDFSRCMILGYSPLFSLLYRDSGSTSEQAFHLKTYTTPENILNDSQLPGPLLFPWENTDNSSKYTHPLPLLYRFLIGDSNSYLLLVARGIVDSLISFAHITVVDHGTLNFLDKLQIVQCVQTLLYPQKGLISFALDPITKRDVQLQFSKTSRGFPSRNTKILDIDNLPEWMTRTGDSYSSWMLKIFEGNHINMGNRNVRRDTWFQSNQNIQSEILRNAFASGLSPQDSFAFHALSTTYEDTQLEYMTGHTRKGVFDHLIGIYGSKDSGVILKDSLIILLLVEAINHRYLIAEATLINFLEQCEDEQDIEPLITSLEFLELVERPIAKPKSTSQTKRTKPIDPTTAQDSFPIPEVDDFDEQTKISTEVKNALKELGTNLDESARPILVRLENIFDHLLSELQEIKKKPEATSAHVNIEPNKGRWHGFRKYILVGAQVVGIVILIGIVFYLILFLLR